MITLNDLLRPGLTGSLGETGRLARAVHPQPAISAWRRACRRALASLRATHFQERPATTGRNYHSVDAALPAPLGPVQIALHVILPFVGAWQDPPASDSPDSRVYWDPPIEPSELPEGFLILPAALLSPAFLPDDAMRHALDPAAWADIRHHQPASVGELVFNRYD